MAKEAMTPAQAADTLYAAIPSGVSREQLEEYGIVTQDEQATAIAKEVLSVNLYWIHSAVHAHIPVQYRAVLFGRILQLVERDWESRFNMEGQEWSAYASRLEERRRAYDRVADEGGGPVAVAGHACTLLEDEWVVEPRDRQKVLALLVDLVPVDRYARIVESAT